MIKVLGLSKGMGFDHAILTVFDTSLEPSAHTQFLSYVWMITRFPLLNNIYIYFKKPGRMICTISRKQVTQEFRELMKTMIYLGITGMGF